MHVFLSIQSLRNSRKRKKVWKKMEKPEGKRQEE
jgi:hypothetical protein